MSSLSTSPSLVYQLPADTVYPLSSPQEFYETLLASIGQAEHRITLASLYIGTGELEQELIHKIRQQCLKYPKLRVAIQLDLCRALRPIKKSTPSTSTSTTDEKETTDYPSQGSAVSTTPPHEPLSQQLHTLQTAVPADAQSPRSIVHAHPTDSSSDTHTTKEASRMVYSTYASSAQHLLRLYQPLGTDNTRTNDTTAGDQPNLASRVRIGLTLMPQLRGLLGRYIPPRWIEAGGVFHIKAYVIDNHTIILSGANLSQDYFTNRQDRYIVIRKPSVNVSGSVDYPHTSTTYTELEKFTEYLHSLIDDIATVPGSHLLFPDGKVQHVPLSLQSESNTNDNSFNFGKGSISVPPYSPLPLPVYNAANTPSYLHAIFNKEIYARLRKRSNKAMNYLASSSESPSPSSSSSTDTSSSFSSSSPNSVTIYPRIQLGTLQLKDDELQTLNILHHLEDFPQQVCYIATGYFNLPSSLIQAIIGDNETYRIRNQQMVTNDKKRNEIQTSIHIVTAAPRANGFFGASGMSGAIPVAYSEMERSFYDNCREKNRLMRGTEKNNTKNTSLIQLQGPGVGIYEYNRDGWTFHGKGLWLMDYVKNRPKGSKTITTDPSLIASSVQQIITLVGSPNFGVRSINRDLELQCTFITKDKELMQRLCKERDALFGLPATEDTPTDGLDQENRSTVTTSRPAVQPIGPHLGKEYDVWALKERQLYGWSWANGLWIHLGRRILAPFF